MSAFATPMASGATLGAGAHARKGVAPMRFDDVLIGNADRPIKPTRG